MSTSLSTLLATLAVVALAHDAAAQPSGNPTAEPVVAPDDFDLSSLGLNPAAAFDDKLNIFGFADFSYQALNFTNNAVIKDMRSFISGNLNLYLTKNLTRSWRTLAEVRFLFAPNGNTKADGTITSTTTGDAANLGRPIEWGGIRIERAYLEYDLSSKLSIRVGRFLTPYGIWNIDHGSPTIISSFRPYVIGEQFFPEHQTGIELFGATYAGEYRLAYHATVSNGRSPIEAQADPDSKLAFGGRLELGTQWGGKLDFGVSGYAGRATGSATSALDVPASYDEVAYAADVEWKHEGFLVQGEVMSRERRYLTGRRSARGAGFQPNGRDVGGYVLAGHRFDRAWNVMPYMIAEHYKPLELTLFEKVNAVGAGVNFRPTPTVVLKAQVTVAETDGAGQYGVIGRLYFYSAQAAWVF